MFVVFFGLKVYIELEFRVPLVRVFYYQQLGFHFVVDW